MIIQKKKKNGAALLMVIIVLAVMTILGTSLLSVSLAQTKEASNEDKRLQAYYLARSGADATLKAWEKSSEADKPSGTANTVYLNSSNQFVDSAPSNLIGKFDVTVTPPSGGNTDTIITSVGTVGNVSQTVTVTIKTDTTEISIPPASLSDALLGHNISWYDYTSGQIITGVHPKAPSGKTVKFEAKGVQGLKIPNKNSLSATYEADKMVFTSTVQVLHNSIQLISTLIAFNNDVDFSTNDGKGDITLKVPLGGGVSVPGRTGTFGIVYFKNVGYYFPDGVVLKNRADITSKLYPILSTDPNYQNPYLSAQTQTVSSYSVLWN